MFTFLILFVLAWFIVANLDKILDTVLKLVGVILVTFILYILLNVCMFSLALYTMF